MGVNGFWRLVESSGKPVPLETLENKVLAIDISLWLHQSIKGFQDSKGAPIPNSHLLGIYHRLCKLLYFKIKPVFVFDGGVPALKKQTIAKRNQSKLKTVAERDRLQSRLFNTLLKYSAVDKVLSEQMEIKNGKKSKQDNMYLLSHNPESDVNSSASYSSTDDDTENASESSPTKYLDLHNVDVNSTNFKSLPVDVRYEILTDLKETRKQSSWGKIAELPDQSGQFSNYQLNRLLKRQAVQTALEEAEKEMGGKPLSLVELETLLKDQGVIKNEDAACRIASDESKKYLLVKNLKKTFESAKAQELSTENKIIETQIEKPSSSGIKNKADIEYEQELERAIMLSLKDSGCSSPSELTNNQQDKLQQFSLTDLISSSNKGLEMKHNVPCNTSDKISDFSAGVISSNYSELDPTKDKLIPKSPVQTQSSNVFEQKLSDESDESKIIINETSIISSSSDSSDFEEVVPKETLNVIINPNISLKHEDDLFKDVFSENSKQSDVENYDKIIHTSIEEKVDYIDDAADSLDSYSDKNSSANNLNLNREEIVAEEQVSPVDSIKQDQFDHSKNLRESENDVTKNKIIDNTSGNTETKEKSLNRKELMELKNDLQEEKINLMNAKSSKDRHAANITDQMYQEAQELLELFGVPYIIAPMEAEAQCAYLEEINLTEGTITDDSDIWLFGAKTVYKNFFNQNKYVMEFRSENIKHHFKLTRSHMILLALLVGSDYTNGLQGVGPVTAMEILAAFPPLKGKFDDANFSYTDLISGLKEFKIWFTKGKSSGPGRASLKGKLKNLVLSSNFPSIQVVQAYLDPSLDKSDSPFSWSKPNVPALIAFAQQKFGWTANKTEDILNPVMKRLEEVEHQKSIKDYFKTTLKIHSDIENRMSKRIRLAVSNLNKSPSEIVDKDVEDCMKKQAKAKTKSKRECSAKYKFKQKKSESDKCEAKTTEEYSRNNTAVSRKVNLGKLNVLEHPSSEPSTSGEKILDSGDDEVEGCHIKIDKIIRRRKLKQINLVANSKQTKTKSTRTRNTLLPSRQRSKEPVEKMCTNIDQIQTEPNCIENSSLSSSSNAAIQHLNSRNGKEIITQVENDKMLMLRNKLKAIESFRKSKRGPGYVRKTKKKEPLKKLEVNLSESGSD